METNITFENKRLLGIGFVVGLLLFVPFIAMRFTNEVNWTPFDFVVAAVLLLGTGLTIEIVLRIVKKFEYRVALCAAILVGLFIVWAELAVGIIGSRFAGS